MLLWVGFYVELLNSFYDMRPALPDFYRNDPCLHFGGFEAQEGHRGFPAVGVALVEHEIAEAVEYGVPMCSKGCTTCGWCLTMASVPACISLWA